MSKHESQYHKLSKEDKQRHFANEHGNGKGSHPRRYSKQASDNYRNNPFWDK